MNLQTILKNLHGGGWLVRFYKKEVIFLMQILVMVKEKIHLLWMRLTCRHQYKCIFLSSIDGGDVFSGYLNGKEVYTSRRIVGEYEFACTRCGKRIQVPMDVAYQKIHADAIN